MLRRELGEVALGVWGSGVGLHVLLRDGEARWLGGRHHERYVGELVEVKVSRRALSDVQR